MNDTLIFLVLAGIALIFKWLSSQGSADAEKPDSPPVPNEPAPRAKVPRAPAQSEEEKVRRFLEALGAPPGSQPPAPVRPRGVVPRRVVLPTAQTPPAKARRSWVQPLPPLVTTPEEASPPLTTAPLAPPVLVPATPPLLPVAAPRPVVRQMPVIVAAAPRSVSLGEVLRARGSARQAIILREVLGPPRSLQAFDELRSF
ncbi:MAG: hypothetical protein H0X34_06285 [Chthoniobacterales bacterium]|nr:hypothetical protein [Chthoniobacterales bacterium]